jgi:CubicO group peptidase (beta-lactamase class C family)
MFFSKAEPRAVGLDNELLDAGILKISADFEQIHSWLIVKNGCLVWEKYFQGYTAQDLHEAQSVTKSIQSLLIGIAIDQGFIKSIDEPIIQYFPDYQHLNWGNNKDKITIRHLLTMTAGLEWNELKVSYNQIFSNDASRQMYSEDWLEYALAKPMEFEPGTTFTYSSANPILLSKILLEATQMPPLHFAYYNLFKPLNINELYYQQMPQNPDILADIDLTPLDFAKIGQLVLQDGQYIDNQIVSKKWLQDSFQASIRFEAGGAYGFSWWQMPLANGQSFWEAWGIGGQHIMLFPDYQLLVVFTGGNYEVTRPQEPYFILENYILPALSKV